MKRLTHYISLGLVLLTTLLSLALTACSEEEEFTTSSDARLTFSKDTISFDTVFVGISSPTQRFNVFNKSDKGVRVVNVSLGAGDASRFKMNVDGRFGTSIDDIEILRKDSIFVFVEVNADTQESNTPTLISDEIVFTLESGTRQKVVLEAYGQNIRVLRAEVVTDSMSLDNVMPWVVYDSLVVAETGVLTIQPGTTLCLHSGTDLVVHGSLTIDGTSEEPVTLRGDRTDKLFADLPYDRLDRQWGSIYLSPTCSGCTIRHADIHSGEGGIWCDSIRGELLIENTILHNSGGNGLTLLDSRARIANTQISNHEGDCVSIVGGTVEFIHCTIAQFCPWTASRGNALVVSNYLGDQEHLVRSATFNNCFVTGYADDEVYGIPGDHQLPLVFNSCVLLTDVSDTTYFHACTAESEEFPCYKEGNFRFDTKQYVFDFHLDSLSTAIGKGDGVFSTLYPTDMNGVPRPAASPDAGCYQR